MGENNITISVDEYNELLELRAGVKTLKRFVNREGAYVDKADCIAIFGFEAAHGED